MSDGKLFYGQEYDRRFNLSYPFVQQMLNYRLNGSSVYTSSQQGDSATDLSPKDLDAVLSRKYDLTAILASLDAYFVKYDVPIQVDTPAVLVSIGVVFNKGEGASEDSHPVANQAFAFVGTGNASLTPRASSQSSASVQPAIYPELKRYPRDIVAKGCEFFSTPTFTEADLLATLTTKLGSTVLSWPVFVERSETIICQGQQASVSAKADTDVTGFVTAPDKQGYAYQYGQGTSTEISTNNTITQLPPCIHGAITITPDTDTADATAEATADSADVVINAVTVNEITNQTGTITVTAIGTITPNTLSATPVPAVPTSGLYLYRWDVDTSIGFGRTFIRAFVINASVFA